YRVGSRDELPGATGIAHFLEHLMFKGTRTLPKGAIDRLTYQNGGSNNAFTFNDYTAYEFNFPKQSWTTALRIEADRMRNSTFDKAEFEAERQVVMEERRAAQDDPEQRFSEQLNTLAFLAHPYRNPVIGWMEDLRRLTRDEVYAIYRRYYVPSNATLVIAGDVSPEEALTAARKAFAAVPAVPAPPRREVTEPAPIAAGRQLRVSLPTGVARLGVVFPLPSRRSADIYPLHVLESILAEGKLGRLYRRLVDRDSTAAAVDSDLGVYRDAGELSFSANAKEGVTPERLEAAFWDEVGRVSEEPVTATDLERARNQFYSEWVHSLETSNDLATVLGEADALGGHEYLDTLLTRIQAVTAADVQRVARKYLRRDRAVVGYLYPQGPGASTAGSAEPPAPRPAMRGPKAKKPGAGAGAARPVRRAEVYVPFKPLRPVEKVLPNGMRLVLLENHALPTITLSTRINAGSLRESDAEAGLSDLVSRMLEEGTGSRTADEIHAELEQVGASFSASAGREATYATLQSLSRYTADLLPLYADLLRAPSFPADRLEQERGRLLVELKEEADDATTVARNAFFELVFGGHPAHRPVSGTQATVRALTRDALLRHHAAYYHPSNATLVAVGDFKAAEMLERLTAQFGAWPKSDAPAPPPLPAIARQK
ncbi:MAG TPA: pitrilysin family protein, partial [Armatimonadota bacterium]|nr:pitrilysin family protein [Armatimonadota bacterium]